MEWTSDIAAGEWIRPRLAAWGPPFAMHITVPAGFEAYARIFHPAARERPVDRAWPPLPHDDHRREWAAFSAAAPEIDTEHVSWSEVAQTFGTTMHPTAQWHRLIRQTDPYSHVEVEDVAGWRYSGPEQGRLAPEVLAAAASTLALHTKTPDTGHIAIWEGWGGVLGAMMSPTANMTINPSADTPVEYTSLKAMLARSIHNPWNDGYAKDRWTPGILSDDISRGPRLELPNRAHVLFTGGINEFVDASWPERAPWRDDMSPEFTHSPSLIWPEDRAWVLATEVDHDSTVVGGSAALVAALCADPRLEALPLPAHADLTSDGDAVNR